MIFLTGARTTSLKSSKAKGTAEKQTAKQDSIVALLDEFVDIEYGYEAVDQA